MRDTQPLSRTRRNAGRVAALRRMDRIRSWAGLHVVVVSMMGAIFALDVLTPTEIAASILYIVPLLLTASTEPPKAVRQIGGACVALTLVSAAMAPEGAMLAGWFNCILSLIAIGATMFLAERGERAARSSKQAQAELARLARILTVNEVSTTLAHEISQPLASIVANAGAASRWLEIADGQDEARRAFERMRLDAERAGAVVDRVRRLVRRSPPAIDRVDLAKVAEEAIGLIRDHVDRYCIHLNRAIPPDLPHVRGDPIQLQQVMLNMLLNGVEALAQTASGSRHLRIEARSEAGMVHVAIRDTGVGLMGNWREQLFVPFHTTKAEGVGVGLAISRTIVELHGGEVFVEPNLPRGAVFGFTLPVESDAMRSRT